MLKINGSEVKFETFPNGETKVIAESIIDNVNKGINRVSFKYENDKDLIHLLFFKKYVDEIFTDINTSFQLIIYYMPYSRMDRVEENSVFTLKYVSEFINNLNFQNVNVIEPHSDVTPALLNKVTSNILTIDMLPMIMKEINFNKNNDYIVFPDLGASRRYKNMKIKNVLIGNKSRDFETGEITSLEIIGDYNNKLKSNALIIDDLCSGGYTFYLTAKKLKEMGIDKIFLLVAHTENTILDGKMLSSDLIERVFTTDSIITKDHEKITQYKVGNLIWENSKI